MHTTTVGAWVAVTVTPGRRWVLKSISACNQGAVNVGFAVKGHGFYLWQAVLPVSDPGRTFALQHVLYEGEQLECFISTGPGTLFVSGYSFEEDPTKMDEIGKPIEVPGVPPSFPELEPQPKVEAAA